MCICVWEKKKEKDLNLLTYIRCELWLFDFYN